jgi:hypothetical protein
MYQELSNKIEGKHIKRMNNSEPLTSKKQLFVLLEMWVKRTENINDTIGNLVIHNKNVQIVKLNIGNRTFYINADTTREGVSHFLQNKKEEWKIIENERGRKNKVTNDSDKNPIQGFYMYKEI